MPLYRITIILKDKTITGVRPLESTDIDTAWQVFNSQAYDAYGEKMLDFESVMISRYSSDYRNYMLKRKEIKPKDKSRVQK